MKYIKLFFVFNFILYCFISNLIAQENPSQGSIKGIVITEEDDKTAPGVGVIAEGIVVDGIPIYTGTDIDGKYLLENLPTGEMTILFQGESYKPLKKKITVLAGQIVELNVKLDYEVTRINIVKGTAEAQNTTKAVIEDRKKAIESKDTLSAEEISKSGDGNAGAAAARVTGVTVVKGNNIFVRGLGERYSSIIFSGSVLPSPNPDRRIVPLNIFPTSILDNLSVLKTYVISRNGEFGGGLVSLTPRSFPEGGKWKLGLNMGAHLQTIGQDFLTYDGGDADILGVNDGTRTLPNEIDNINNLSSASFEQVEQAGESLQNVYTPKNIQGRPNGGLSLSYGNTFSYGKNKDKKLGFLLSGLFKTDYKNRDFNFTRVRANDFSPIIDLIYSTIGLFYF